MNILFLCTGNSCRSIIAESLFNAMAPQGMTAQSAGSKPTGFVHPRALAALEKAGFLTTGLASKSWDNLPVKPDVVVTLCADAAAEPCPLFLRDVVRAHWGLPDTAAVEGDEATITAAFDKTVHVLRKRMVALTELLAGEPGIGKERLAAELDAISRI